MWFTVRVFVIIMVYCLLCGRVPRFRLLHDDIQQPEQLHQRFSDQVLGFRIQLLGLRESRVSGGGEGV